MTPVFLARAWDYDYALGGDTHNERTRAIARNHATLVGFTWANTCLHGFSSYVACSFGLGLYLGTYKRIDHQNTGLVYKNFCSLLQYTIKSKETRIKNKFSIKKGVRIAIKSKETSS